MGADPYGNLTPWQVYGWMPYDVRLKRMSLGATYWLALWDEHPEQEPTLV